MSLRRSNATRSLVQTYSSSFVSRSARPSHTPLMSLCCSLLVKLTHIALSLYCVLCFSPTMESGESPACPAARNLPSLTTQGAAPRPSPLYSNYALSLSLHCLSSLFLSSPFPLLSSRTPPPFFRSSCTPPRCFTSSCTIHTLIHWIFQSGVRCTMHDVGEHTVTAASLLASGQLELEQATPARSIAGRSGTSGVTRRGLSAGATGMCSPTQRAQALE